VLRVCALAIVAVPSVLSGEILYLKDGSEIRGKILAIQADTLTFEPAFGGRIRVHRTEIAKIVFDDSVSPGTKVTPPASGQGVVMVVFEGSNKLTSKIAITNKTKKNESDLIRANWIEQLLIVEGDTVYARVDTTMDKTIYKGHDKIHKNTIRLEDMSVRLDAGSYRCVVVIRNVGSETYPKEFDEGPINLSAEFEMASVQPNVTTELRVAIGKGFLRMGAPKLKTAE